jgi:nucleotidyltransferase/DNA polymerase involved in DNA repair
MPAFAPLPGLEEEHMFYTRSSKDGPLCSWRFVMAVACVLLPHFALRLAVLEHPLLDGQPLVLLTASTSRPTLLDCTPEASAGGVKLDMLPREVVSLCADASFIQSNPAREASAFESVVDSLERFSPSIEPAEIGRCYVELAGLDHHHASLEDAIAQLLRLISPVLRPRIGVAPGKFSAWVAARRASAGSGKVVPQAEVAPFLRDVSASWLPCSTAMRQSLKLLGLLTLGQIAELPASAMQARFGPEGRRVAELARGVDEEQIRPIARAEAVVESMQLSEPIASREMILLGLRHLIIRAFDRRELSHRQVRRARFQVLIEDHRSWERVMTFREPLGRDRLIETLRHRLQEMELSGPAERLVLELKGFVHEIARQELIPLLRPPNERPVIEAARQLKARYGESPLFHVVKVESWSIIPERRHALISYDP